MTAETSLTVHRFRPRYRVMAGASAAIGAALAIFALASGGLAVPLVTGVLGVALGAGYLASPTWRLAVAVDETGLEVRSKHRTRFRLAWPEVVRVIAAPAHHSCFVDGGAPERSLLVPGVGAPAPYDLEDRPALVATILAHVPAERVVTVKSLEEHRREAGSRP
ncbi:MAG: hypothetical protein AB7P03_26050 [Kofleriaceae bacterium]